MNKSSHQVLLADIAKRLAVTGAATDHLLLTRWRVLGLAQHLIGSFGGDAENLSVEALTLYAREGSGRQVDNALQRASAAIASETLTRTGSLLPSIAPDIRDDVLSRLKKYEALGDPAIQQAIDALPALQDRLRTSPAGAIQSGIRYRLELVAAVARDKARPSEYRRRAASAILYLREIHDAIPDTLGHIGLLDDDFALRVVLDEFGEYTEDEKRHWAERISAIWEDLPFLQGVQLRRNDGPVATTWLDRINSYVSYLHVLDGAEEPLVLVQPSIVCSPLHTIVSLIGLLMLEGLTSSQDPIKSLCRGQTYEIDGKYRAQYDGLVDDSNVTGWLRLKFRDATISRPPTFANRMVAVGASRLSTAKDLYSHRIAGDAEPLQRFFGWNEAIGAGSVPSRVLFVTSRQRALGVLGGIKSNDVSLLGDGLVRFAGLDPSPETVRAALVLVVPNLRVVRELLDQGIEVHAVLVDGNERLRRGRHDLPFLLLRPSPPPVIVWSAIGYCPDAPPSWLLQQRRLGVGADELSCILELDGDLDQSVAPSLQSLWEAATGAGIKQAHAPCAPAEERILAMIDTFLRITRASDELPDHWKYQLFSWATTLRALVSSTAGYWDDIREFVGKWDTDFRELWAELRPRAAAQLAYIAEARESVSSAVSSVAAESNSKADALIAFCKREQHVDWRAVFDRGEQVVVMSRFARRQGLKIDSVLLRDLDVCQDCVVFGWTNKSFARRLHAHTPRRLVAIANDRDWERWERVEAYSWGKNEESLLGALGHRVLPSAPPPTELESLLDDDVPIWEPGDAKNSEEEQRVPCVFLWLADETRGKVLARDSRVLVETGDHAREKPAHNILLEDPVILGPGSSRWSPADEFTEVVVQAVRSLNPQLVRDAREWRVALRKLQCARGWTPEELQARLADVGVHRKLQTLEGWLQMDLAAPIGPRNIHTELESIWELIGDQSEQSAGEVIKACKRLRSLCLAAGRALIDLWKGRTTDVGVDQVWMQELVERLRHEVQVQVVEAITYGRVPDSMLGWWVIPELASRFELDQDSSVSDS